MRRADTVRAFLVSQGIALDRIEVVAVARRNSSAPSRRKRAGRATAAELPDHGQVGAAGTRAAALLTIPRKTGYHAARGVDYDHVTRARRLDGLPRRGHYHCPVGCGAGHAGKGRGLHAPLHGKDFTGWVYGQRPNGTENKSGKGYQIEKWRYLLHEGGRRQSLHREGVCQLRLPLEFKLTPNANNGIGIRAPLVGDAAYVGMEIQVLDDSGSQYTNLLPGQYHGSIYKVAPAKRGFQKPVGEWNSEEITAKGRQITVKLNGTTIVDFNLDDVKDEATLKEHRDLSKPEGREALRTPRGHIGFLGHGAHVEFRNIRNQGAVARAQPWSGTATPSAAGRAPTGLAPRRA